LVEASGLSEVVFAKRLWEEEPDRRHD
jgi:hypothetical protein